MINSLYIPGPPATVEVDIMVRSMGPISEVDMVIYFLKNITLRQKQNQKSSKQLLFILLNYPHKFVYPLSIPSLCLDIFHGLLFSPIVG